MSKNFDESIYKDNKGVQLSFDEIFDAPEITQEELDESYKDANLDDFDIVTNYGEETARLLSEMNRESQEESVGKHQNWSFDEIFDAPEITQEELDESYESANMEDFDEAEDIKDFKDSDSRDTLKITRGKYSIEVSSDADPEEIEKITQKLEQMEQVEQKRALDKMLTSEGANPYAIAKRLLNKYRFIYLDPPYKNKTLSYYNGSYWTILHDSVFDAIIYRSMSEEERNAEKRVKSFTNSVKAYIDLECSEGYLEKKRRYFFTKEDFAEVEYSTVFRNGVYDIKDGCFYKNKDTSKLPYTMALDAVYYEEDDKRQDTYYMDKLLRDASRDESVVQMAYEVLGYLAVPCHNAKSFFTLAGVGDSGKSVFGGFCESIYAEDRTFRMQPHLLTKQFAFSSADVAYLYSCLDMETRFLTVNEVSVIKQMSGEENLRSEAKHKNEKTIPIRFKLLLATNGAIQCDPRHPDPALYRRLQILPFLFATNEKDMIADLPKRLQDEKSAILSKAVRAVSKCVNENGLISFHTSKMSADLKAVWSGTIDYDKYFFEDAFEITGNPEDVVCKQDVSSLYASYCEKNYDKMKIRSQASALFGKIGNLDSRIVFGSSVKSRKNLGADFPNPVACFKGIKWNEHFLDTYYDKRFLVECHRKQNAR